MTVFMMIGYYATGSSLKVLVFSYFYDADDSSSSTGSWSSSSLPEATGSCPGSPTISVATIPIEK
jgi:hypothetical protein